MRNQLTSRRRLTLAGATILLVAAVALVMVALSGRLTSRHSLRVEARDLSPTNFVFQPDPLVAPASTAVALTFFNSSAEPHTLIMLGPLAIRTDHNVPSGQSRLLEFTTPVAGTYRFVCTVHEGMTGNLLVE